MIWLTAHLLKQSKEKNIEKKNENKMKPKLDKNTMPLMQEMALHRHCLQELQNVACTERNTDSQFGTGKLYETSTYNGK